MTGMQENQATQGMILIVVLWAVSLMTLTVVAISALSQKSLSLAGAETDRMRSELALEAGMAAAQALIMAEKPENRVYFNGSPQVLDLGSGRLVEISIRDASGLLDLNRAEPGLIEQFIKRNVEVQEAGGVLLKAIRELRPDSANENGQDSNTGAGTSPQAQSLQAQRQEQPRQSTSTATGQSTPEQTEKSPRRPPPAFASTGQLYGIAGVPDEVLDKLLPLITLYSSQEGKVNPLAAPDQVLLSIPGLGARELKLFETARQKRQWRTAVVQASLGTLEKFLAIGTARSFVISVKLLKGPGINATSHLTASVVSDETGRQAFQAMAWSW